MSKLTFIFLAFLYASNTSATVYDVSGLFSAYDPGSTLMDGSTASVTGTYDDVAGVMNLGSVVPFFGLNWTAGGDIITTPGSYDVDTGVAGSITGIEVGEGQWFGHLLFDWGATQNTDLVLVWDVTHQPDGSIKLISTDVISDLFPTGSGALGHPVIDGATVGFSYSFDLLLTPIPLPAAMWLFGSGLLTLVGITRHKKAA